MKKQKFPVTPAIRKLKANKIDFESYLYEYTEKGGTKTSSKALNVDEHIVIKTLIMEDENKKPMIILMHGDMEVSTKNLARFIGVKQITPCAPNIAQKHSGYLVGGTSPFGTQKKMPVYAEKSIFDLDKIYLNGGKRGFLISIKPNDLKKTLNPITVEVGIK